MARGQKAGGGRARMPRQVDYYFSLSSPWAYIGHKAFRDVVATYDLKVNHKPVILVDLFSETGGLPLIKRHPVRQRYRMVELQRWRDKRGLNFHLQPKYSPFNARLAGGLVIAAIEAGYHFCGGPFWRSGKMSSIWPTRTRWPNSPTRRGFPANSWSSALARRRSARPMSRTARTHSQPTCLAGRAMGSTARYFGDRTASNCSPTH